MAAGYSTAAVSMGHLALKRTIRHAEANDLVTRNVAALADTPKGRQGRPGVRVADPGPGRGGVNGPRCEGRRAGKPRANAYLHPKS
jgi:hypothetical protein